MKVECGLTDGQLFVGSEEELQDHAGDMAEEIVYLREKVKCLSATLKRIEEWADELDGSAYCLLGSRGIAAELRNRIKGTP